MTIRVQHKRSAVKGKVPQPADLEYGEIAVNYEATDPSLYVKDSANAVRKIGTPPNASTTVHGVVQLADAAAVTAGTAGLVVDAAQLKAHAATDATMAAKGVVQLADAAAITAGTVGRVVDAAQLKAAKYALPTASATVLGGVKVGTNLAIDATGILSAKVTGALVFKGAKDPTVALPPTPAPATGDVYVMSTAGVLAAGWTGLVGTSVALHELVVWDGTEWVLMGSAVETTVHTVTGTAPLHATGTTAVTLRVDDATAAAKGVVQLADAAAVTAGTAGRVVDAAQLKAHTPSDASTTAKGVVQLADAAAITAGTAGRVVDAAELKAAKYTLPTATAAALGGVKVGTNLSIDANGILSAKVTGALVFKGAKDPTVALPTAPAPATGDVYVMNKAGVLAAGWTGLVGTSVSIHELVVFDGTEWVLMGSAVETTVHTITATAPLHAAGTTAVTMRVDDASATAKGVVQLATAAEVTAGTDTAKAVTSAGVKVELDKKAPLASPSLTGTPTAPTAAAGTNTTQLATTAFVHAATPNASETAKGVVELATAAETTAGTDGTRAVHPAGLKVELDKKVNKAGDTMTGNLTVPTLNGLLVGMITAFADGVSQHYMQFDAPNGKKIQLAYGQVSVTNGNAGVTFTRPFVDNPTVASSAISISGPGEVGVHFLTATAKTGISFYAMKSAIATMNWGGSPTGSIHWVAIGGV